MSFLNKVSSLYEKGKQKLKEKFNKNIQSENKQQLASNQVKTPEKENLKLNIKLGNTNVTNSNSNITNQKTKITPVKVKKEEDIFKIETDKEFTYKIQDIDSDEEEETPNNNNNENNIKSNKNEYLVVDYKKPGESTASNLENEEKIGSKIINTNISSNPSTDDESKMKINEEKINSSDQVNHNTNKNHQQQNELLSAPSKTIESEETNEFLDFEYENIFNISHRLLSKGAVINISENYAVPCLKIKDKNKLFSLVGISKEKINIEYLLFFDEYFLYPIKNVPLLKNNINLRKVGNRYDLRLIRNILIKVFVLIIKNYFNYIYIFL